MSIGRREWVLPSHWPWHALCSLASGTTLCRSAQPVNRENTQQASVLETPDCEALWIASSSSGGLLSASEKMVPEVKAFRWQPTQSSICGVPTALHTMSGWLSLPVGQCVLPFSQPRECALFICRSRFKHCWGWWWGGLFHLSSLCMGGVGEGWDVGDITHLWSQHCKVWANHLWAFETGPAIWWRLSKTKILFHVLFCFLSKRVTSSQPGLASFLEFLLLGVLVANLHSNVWNGRDRHFCVWPVRYTQARIKCFSRFLKPLSETA